MPPKAPAKKAAAPKPRRAAAEKAVGAYWTCPAYKCDAEGTPLCQLPRAAEIELGLINTAHERMLKKGSSVKAEVWAAPNGYGEEDCPYAGAGLYVQGQGGIFIRWLDSVDDVLAAIKCV